jgi:putative PIN family toxin of toxin-antitoxin system
VIRAVLDANVVVAAMLNPSGVPGDVVSRARQGYELVWSPSIVAECHRVAEYRKVRNRFRVANPHGFIDDLAAAGVMVTSDLPQVEAVRADPSDDIYVATALVGAAGWIISGDRHLLSLKRFAGVSIVTPATFLEELRRS